MYKALESELLERSPSLLDSRGWTSSSVHHHSSPTALAHDRSESGGGGGGSSGSGSEAAQRNSRNSSVQRVCPLNCLFFDKSPQIKCKVRQRPNYQSEMTLPDTSFRFWFMLRISIFWLKARKQLVSKTQFFKEEH